MAPHKKIPVEQPAPTLANILLARLMPTIVAARDYAWTVNVAIETGGEFEHLTFSASRRNLELFKEVGEA